MAIVRVGASVGAGFGLIRRKPLAMLGWGLVLAVAFGGLMAGYVGFFANMYSLQGLDQAALARGGPPPVALFARMIMAEGGLLSTVMVLMVLMAIVRAAVWRAVLHPEQGRWGYLRVGLAELFTIAISMAVGFIANFAIFPLMPFIFVVGALVYFHQFVAAVIVGVLAVVAMVVGVIYLQLRFVLLGPMIVDDGRFHFFEAWRLSRGKVGSLFRVGLTLFAIMFVAQVLLEVIALVAGAGSVGLAAGGFDKLHDFWQQGPAAIAGRLWPFAILAALVATPIAGCLAAVLYAPWASAYRDLAPGPTAVA